VGVVALLQQLSAAVPLSRARRQELSLLLVESQRADLLGAESRDLTPLVRSALAEVCRDHGRTNVEVVPITASQMAAIIPNCERRGAIAVANDVIAQVAASAAKDLAPPSAHTFTLSAGVATVIAVSKNFDPWRLVESAERCLYAARSCNTNAVKSIEI
jgi:GGDEF domain-containing protein